MAEGIRTRLTRSEGRKFGLSVGTAFLALTALLVWRGHIPAASVTGTLGGLLLLGGLLIPGKLGPVYAAWMGLAGLNTEQIKTFLEKGERPARAA